MKKILTAVLIASAFLFACSNSSEPTGTIDSKAESTTPATDGSVQMPATDNNAAMTPPPAASVQSSPQQATPQQVTSQQTTTAPGMNPPHGQPGHRCDIAVGAPLNSAPATPSPSPQVVTSPNMNAPGISTPQVISAPPPPNPSTTQAVPSTSTAPGMNPPHGQPGHDCAVPVGSPLPKK